MRALSVRNVVLRSSHILSMVCTCVAYIWMKGDTSSEIHMLHVHVHVHACTYSTSTYMYIICMLLLDMLLDSLAEVAFCCLHPAAPYSLSVKGFNGVVALK